MIELRVIQGEPNATRKSCRDCRYKQAAVSWWCVNEGAIENRGTQIPGVRNCPHWEPAKKASWWDRWFNWSAHLIKCESKKDCRDP